jgi:hypothetical protein
MPAQLPASLSDSDSPSDALLILLPILIVLSTFLFLLLSFLICALIIRRRRGIILRDNDGPVDLSREDLIEGDGGFEGVESRWLDGVSENVRRAYLRAKGIYFFTLSSLIYHFCRVSNAIPSQLPPNRHNSLSVPFNSRKRCIRLVFRTRL